MLTNKEVGIIYQIIKRCERIRNKTENISLEAFINDEDVKEVVCFNIFQIGELSNKLSEDFINKYNKIPWKYINGMRNRIVHGYDTIDLDIVWNTAMISIVELEEYCEEIVNIERIAQC